MSQVHPEIQSDDYHQPNGPFAKALKTANKTILLFIFLYFAVSGFDKIQEFKIKKDLISSWRILYITSYLAIFFYLIYNRKLYTDFIDYFDREIGIYMSNDSIRKFIARNRTLIWIGYPFIYTLYATHGIYDFIKSYQESQSYYQLGMKAFWNLIRSILYLNRYAIIEFIIECCLHTQVCFKMVEDQIKSLKQSDAPLSFEQMQMVRQLYDVAIEKVRKLDALLFWVLPVYYCTCIVSFEINLVMMIYEFNNIHPVLIIREVFILILLTFHIANINRLANATFNQVYSLTYKVESVEMQNEMRFFFTRIGRGDVGLTILKIVLITPAFVTSFVTLSLTISLAIPSIFRKS